MLDCLILGDSIAVGVGQARPACETVARVGITSGAWLQTFLPATALAAKRVVISLGVNDDGSMDTGGNLSRLRDGIRAEQVVWLLPGLKPAVRDRVTALARRFGDRVVDTAGEAGPDRLHPSREGYRVIAARLDAGEPGSAPSPGPRLPLLAPLRPGGAPVVQFPSIYAPWPPRAATYAAIPPPSYAFRAIPSLPRR